MSCGQRHHALQGREAEAGRYLRRASGSYNSRCSGSDVRLSMQRYSFSFLLEAYNFMFRGVYAAAGNLVAVMKTCRHIDRYIEVGAKTNFMKILGDYLVSRTKT